MPFFVFASLGVAALPRKPAWMLTAAIALLALLNLSQYFGTELKPRWGSVAKYVADRAGPCDVIYLEGSLTHFVYDLTEQGLVPFGWRTRRVGATKEATAASASGGRVWAAVGKVAYGPRTPEDVFLKSLSDLGRPAATIRFGQEVVLFRFDPNPNLPPGPTCGGPLS